MQLPAFACMGFSLETTRALEIIKRRWNEREDRGRDGRRSKEEQRTIGRPFYQTIFLAQLLKAPCVLPEINKTISYAKKPSIANEELPSPSANLLTNKNWRKVGDNRMFLARTCVMFITLQTTPRWISPVRESNTNARTHRFSSAFVSSPSFLTHSEGVRIVEENIRVLQ